MECLICYNLSLDNFDKNPNLSQFVCNLLDIDISSSHFVDNFSFCFDCYKKLCHVQRVLKEIEDLKVIVGQIKDGIIKDLITSQQFSEENGRMSDDRTKIVQEINSRLAGDVDDGENGYIVPEIISVFNSNGKACVKLEQISSEPVESPEASPPEAGFIDDAGDHENQDLVATTQQQHNEIDDNTLKDLFIKSIQLSGEMRVVLSPLKLPTLLPSNNIFNINEEPIASFIKSEQIHILSKSSVKLLTSPVKKKRGKKNAAGKSSAKSIESKSTICSLCSKDCKTTFQLTIHMRIHTNEKPFKCSEKDCDKAFRSKSFLNAHLRTHLVGDKIAECPICHKKMYVHYMKRHLQTTHTNLRPYKCEVGDCTKTFKYIQDLNVHTIRLHSDTVFKCTYENCDKVYKSVGCRRNHINTFHLGMKLKKSTVSGGDKEIGYYKKYKNYLCSMCPRGFYSEMKLQTHISIIHTREIILKCKICGKEFIDAWGLKKHELMHTDERNHVCDICGEAFHIKFTLLRHMRNHKKQNKLVLKRIIPLAENPNAKIITRCSTCNKGFINNRDRIRHEKIHSGQSDHPCNFCVKSYYDRHGLKRHMKMNHPDKIHETETTNQN